MISRRTFLRSAAAAAYGFRARTSDVSALSLSPAAQPSVSSASSAAEVLYNGITLGSPWPPRRKYPDESPVPPPYLIDPPAVIPIDIGRQLFVDDFLIEETTLTRTFHRATYHPGNPVLGPETRWEVSDNVAERTGRPVNPTAMVFSDGVFFDPADRLFKMWYMAGYGGATCLATSQDGIDWHRPAFDVVPGTNVVQKDGRDSTTVWLDLETRDRRQRYKMSAWFDNRLLLRISPDGVHWTQVGESKPVLDRSTFFYNPFRKVWVFSLRATQYFGSVSGRYRLYWESPDFAAARDWSASPPVAWVKSDSRDVARPDLAERPELYNLDCVAYESLLLGLFSVWRGESPAREKVNEIALGFSRDGFHWHRPDRQSFLSVSDTEGAWNWANVQSAGGGCAIVGDRLHFYVSGRQGRPGTNDPGVCSTGLATLRRDGFASMDWLPDESRVVRGGPDSTEGTLTTRPVRFGGSYLFVNADLGGGDLRVEVLDRDGRAIAPFTRAACKPVTGVGTRLAVEWTSGSLASLRGQIVRFRFSMTRGRLFAFWTSPWPSGESQGYVAAGGPGFSGPVDRKAS